MEKNELEREKAGISRQKTGQGDSRMQNPRQRYIIGALYEKLQSALNIILPGRSSGGFLEKNYKLKIDFNYTEENRRSTEILTKGISNSALGDQFNAAFEILSVKTIK